MPRIDVSDVAIVRSSAFCNDCLWVDNPNADPRYSLMLRRSKAHVSKNPKHQVVIDQLFRRRVEVPS